MLKKLFRRFFKSVPQPETTVLFSAVAVMLFAGSWDVYFSPDGANTPLALLIYGLGSLIVIGVLCLCRAYGLSGEKEGQEQNDENTQDMAETTAPVETRDIYINDVIENLKKIDIRANIDTVIKKYTAAVNGVVEKCIALFNRMLIKCVEMRNSVRKKYIVPINRFLTKCIASPRMVFKEGMAALKALIAALPSYMDRRLMIYAFLFTCTQVGENMSFDIKPYFQPMVFADFLRIPIVFCLTLVIGSLLKLIISKCSIEMQTGEISKKWWFCVWLLLVVLWSPYLMAYYPGTLSSDSFDSLMQIKKVLNLNNHCPVAYTLLIGFFVRIGWKFGDANFGVFIYSFIQMVIMAGVLGYSVYWVRKKVGNRAVALVALLFYGLNPIVALYAITMWKDVLFAAWIVLLSLFLFDMAADGGEKLGEKKSLFQLSLLFILIAFGRNNGVYVVILCWTGLLLFFKNTRKKLLMTGGVILAIILVQGRGYKLLGIGDDSFVESVGIPLQQICYTVVADGPLEKEEQEFLDDIIPIRTIKESYSPTSVDYIKFHPEFNTAFFEQNKLNFVKLYLKLLPKHFRAYVQSYLLSTSGFWRIEQLSWLVQDHIYENDMGIYNVDYFKEYFNFDSKAVVSGWVSSMKDGPLTNVGLMVWFVFFYVLVCRSGKQTWKAFLALPVIGCWVTMMIATPVSSQFRYVYYYHLMLPVTGIMFFVKRAEDMVSVMAEDKEELVLATSADAVVAYAMSGEEGGKWKEKWIAASRVLKPNIDQWLIVYAFLFSCMLVAGGKMNIGGNPYFKPVAFVDFLKFAVFFCLSLIMVSLIKFINSRYLVELRTGEISRQWWEYAWLGLVAMWSPYLLSYYPGILSSDSFAMLMQVKQLQPLNNQIPVAYTLLVGFFVKIGWEIGDTNFGIFLFSFVQMVIMAGVLSYSTYWVRKKVKYRAAAVCTLLFYGMNPIAALYAITMWKDGLFSAWIVLLCLFLSDMAADGGRKLGERKNLRRLCLLFALISFGRGNGVYAVILCWLVLLLIYKNVRKKLLTAGGVILAVMFIQGPGYKALGIVQAGFAESAGIPIQQICYTLVTDGPLEEGEQAFLENVIPIQTIVESYSPVSVDSIKFHPGFNAAFLEQNKPGFVRLYLGLLPSHFRAYVQSYLLSTSGFWHIEPLRWFVQDNINGNELEIYNVDYFKRYFHFDWKEAVSGMISFLSYGGFINVGLMVWLVFLFIAMCFSQKQRWKAMLALPLIGCWITLMIATPASSQFRFIYYYYLMLPVIGIMFFVKRDTG